MTDGVQGNIQFRSFLRVAMSLEIVGKENVEIGKLEISGYDEGKEYPCEMWLTLGIVMKNFSYRCR
jgi:hypothetical protein